MACFAVKIYFVNSCEVVSFTVSDRIQSPFAALQRIVAARGLDNFSAAWSDEFHNFFPLKSDRGFIDALRARSHHLQPLRIYVKEARVRRGSYGACGYQEASYARPRHNAACDGPSSIGPWREHKIVIMKEQLLEEAPPMKSAVSPTVMPKDPTLAELVDKVRLNLDLVASMHSSQTTAIEIEHEDQENCPPVGKELIMSDLKTFDSVAVQDTVKCDISLPVAESSMKDDGLLSELLEEYAEEEALLREVPRRSDSVLSDFMVITPSADSCVHFSMEDFEAAMKDLEGEDTFEIVDVPEDWDSDIEWKELEGVN